MSISELVACRKTILRGRVRPWLRYKHNIVLTWMARMRKTTEFESISRFKYNQQRMYNAPSRLTGRECSTILKSVNFTIFDSPFLSARALTEPRYANEESRRRRRKKKKRGTEKRGEKKKKGKKGKMKGGKNWSCQYESGSMVEIVRRFLDRWKTGSLSLSLFLERPRFN